MNNKNLVQLQYKNVGHCPFFKAIFEKSSLLLKQKKKRKKRKSSRRVESKRGKYSITQFFLSLSFFLFFSR